MALEGRRRKLRLTLRNQIRKQPVSTGTGGDGGVTGSSGGNFDNTGKNEDSDLEAKSEKGRSTGAVSPGSLRWGEVVASSMRDSHCPSHGDFSSS